MSRLNEMIELDNWFYDIYFEVPLSKNIPKMIAILNAKQNMIKRYYNNKIW